ncbi:MAG: FAD-dependent oxidoreductase [Caldilineaceae bacterium]
MTSQSTDLRTTQILILGAGYSGVMAALRLAGRTKGLKTTIILLNAQDHFVERPRLHEQATGTVLQRRALPHMLRGTPVRFIQGRVVALNPTTQQVEVETGSGVQHFRYDYLINALGSRVNRPNIPGVQEYAHTLDPDGKLATDALRAKLTTLGKSPFRAVVVGGGATGIEAATQIKGCYPQSEVTIVTQGAVGAFKGAQVQKHLQGALREQAITPIEQASVLRVSADGVWLADQRIPADLILWAGGFVASPLAREAGLQVNAQNQLLVDPYLRSFSHPNIYAVGDAAFPVEEPGAPIRMSLFTALVSGAQAAENIAATLKGQPLQPLSFVWYGQGIALGPNDAVGFATYPVDQAWPLIFRRALAVRVRNFFVWYLSFALELERRFPGSFIWNGKGRYARQQRHSNRATAVGREVQRHAD